MASNTHCRQSRSTVAALGISGVLIAAVIADMVGVVHVISEGDPPESAKFTSRQNAGDSMQNESPKNTPSTFAK